MIAFLFCMRYNIENIVTGYEYGGTLHMKKAIVILLSVALLVSLAGCHAVTPSGSSSVSVSPSSEAQSAITGESVASSKEVFSIPSTIGTPTDHVTYLYDSDYYPVSHMKEGAQILSGDVGMCGFVNEYIGRTPSVENLKRHYIKDMYDDSGKTLFDESEYSLSDLFICSNGDWDFFPTKVRYEKYTLQNQPDKPEWDEYFMSRIKEVSDVTPLIYTNAYFFDWNGDGIEDALVYACNTFDSNEDCEPNPPYYDKTATYNLSVLFLSGNIPFEIDGYVTDYVTKKPCDNDNRETYNESIDHFDSHEKSAIQYDSEGNLMVCPIFIRGEYMVVEEDIVILSDIDGDGKTELIIIDVNEYSGINIYKLINGKPIKVFKIFEGA